MELPLIKRRVVIFVLLLTVMLTSVVFVFGRRVSGRVCEGASAVEMGGKEFIITLANSPEMRRQGLSNTQALSEDAGMLFVYDNLARREFWMKDMNYSIDIIWIDEQWKVSGIVHSLSPETYPATVISPEKVRYVLEVNAGVARSFPDVATGTQLVLLGCGNRN